MADHQRIHPVNTSATTPLAPRGSLRSEKEGEASHYYPPLRRTFPVSYSKPPKSRSCTCCRCLCWTISLIVLLVIILAATAGILYLVFRPKVPNYSINQMKITNFAVSQDMSVTAQFEVTVTSTNPNEKIGIYYEEGSKLEVWYTDTQLCNGTFPKFYQGHRNTTVLVVELAGESQIESGLLTALQQQQQTGSIPLVFRAEVPVRVKFGALKMRKVRFFVRCNLIVNSLSVNNMISIRSSSCRFMRLKL